MHHGVVRRVVLLLWLLIAAAVAGFAWLGMRVPAPAAAGAPGQGGAVAAGRTLFDESCASCHRCGELAADGSQAPRLVAALADHGPTAVVGDLEIVAYLVGPDACRPPQEREPAR